MIFVAFVVTVVQLLSPLLFVKEDAPCCHFVYALHRICRRNQLQKRVADATIPNQPLLVQFSFRNLGTSTSVCLQCVNVCFNNLAIPIVIHEWHLKRLGKEQTEVDSVLDAFF